MLNWILRGILIVAGVVASWFVTRDSPQFGIMQIAVVLLLIVFIVAILAFWPERFSGTAFVSRGSRAGRGLLPRGLFFPARSPISSVSPRVRVAARLRAYTSSARYLALSAGACRVGLDGNVAAMVTPEDEAVAKARRAELAKGTAPRGRTCWLPKP